MAVVDFHVHVAKKGMWREWVDDFFKKVNPTVYKDFDECMKAENVLRMMDREGVDSAVVLAEAAPLTTGMVSNEFVADFCKASERLVPFASIHPKLDPNPPRTLRYCVEELGMRGLKLLPSYQHFYPNEAGLYPLYEVARELGVPVMFHTGSSIFRNARLKYSDPLYLDDVAVDFSDLTIIQAHGGRGFWYAKAAFLTKLHENVHLEISGLPPCNLLEYFPDLERIADKVIFGSDWPGIPSIRANIEAIRGLPINDEAKRKILGENASRILKAPS